MGRLRVIDAGMVGAARSQSLWHGIASAMGRGAETTLSLCVPEAPYVCLGYHRSLAEVDLEACRERGLRVIRRQIGGGTVYNDSDQLFFQITLPAQRAAARVDLLYERLLGPAVKAFRRLGLDASLRGTNDIAVGDRRLSGTGAGRIGEAVTVVGNVIFRFPHRRMVDVLALPSESMRESCHRLMRRHVSSLHAEGLGGVTMGQAGEALAEAYAEDLDLEPVRAQPTAAEESEMQRWETKFADPEWLAGPQAPRRLGRQVKICADTWVFEASHEDLHVEAAIVGGQIESVAIEAAWLDGQAPRIRRALLGRELSAVVSGSPLAEFGEAGDRVLKILRPGLELH